MPPRSNQKTNRLTRVFFVIVSTRCIALLTWCVNFVFANRFVDGIADGISMILVSQMIQHIDRCIQHGHGVGNVLAGNSGACITGTRLENGILQEAFKLASFIHVNH